MKTHEIISEATQEQLELQLEAARARKDHAKVRELLNKLNKENLPEGWGDPVEDDPELLKAADYAIMMFKRAGRGYERTYPAEMNGNGASAGIGDWGNWENPEDAHDEEDYDWQRPTKETVDKARRILAQVQKQFPNIDFELGVEEKNSMDVYAKHKKVNEDEIDEAMAWAKSGNKVVRKFRCSSGPRKGRVVSNPAQCFAPPDIKKRIKLKQTKAKQGPKMAKKRKKTLRTNAASKRVRALNKKR